MSSSAAACSSKSKETQKRLRRARPEGAIDAPSEGRVQNQLRALAVVEAALDDDALSGRQVAERGQPGGAVGHHLLGHLGRHAGTLAHQGACPVAVGRRAGAARARPAGRRPPRTARPCAPAPRPARRGRSVAGRRRRRRAPCPPRPWPPATSGCRAGRCPRRWPRPQSPRAPNRPSRRRDRGRPGSRPSREWRRRRSARRAGRRGGRAGGR